MGGWKEEERFLTVIRCDGQYTSGVACVLDPPLRDQMSIDQYRNPVRKLEKTSPKYLVSVRKWPF